VAALIVVRSHAANYEAQGGRPLDPRAAPPQ
jgi:hypothetical protein